MPRPPTNRCSMIQPSKAAIEACGAISASRNKLGVNSSDCGSAALGWPPKWYGFQSGISPCCSEFRQETEHRVEVVLQFPGNDGIPEVPEGLRKQSKGGQGQHCRERFAARPNRRAESLAGRTAQRSRAKTQAQRRAVFEEGAGRPGDQGHEVTLLPIHFGRRVTSRRPERRLQTVTGTASRWHIDFRLHSPAAKFEPVLPPAR